MDVIALTVAGAAYVAAAVAKKCVDLPIEKAFDHVVSSFCAKLGRKPEPADFDVSIAQAAGLQDDKSLSEEADRIFRGSSALRRARLVESVLRGARLLWVDDVPENNIYEQQVLRAFGVLSEIAKSTDEALQKIGHNHYDLIVSDMARDREPDAGLKLLKRLRESRNQTPIVYYVGHVDHTRGTPTGASGIADRPESLFHYVLDVLERSRV